MEYKKFNIAGGNSTALVWGINDDVEERSVTKKLLESVEQVGFINFTGPSLKMMGDELCINATLAAANLLGGKGRLNIADRIVVSYKSRGCETSIFLELNFSIPKTGVVLFESIGYVFVDNQLSSKELSKLAKKYKLPAFGSIMLSNNQITPRVYVVMVDSCVDESSCGSGSIATAIMLGIEDIKQPSGGVISVKRTGKRFCVAASVEEIIC